jgi:hypothetical protein
MIGQSLLSQMLPASRDIRYGQGQNQGQMMGGGGDGRSANPGWDAMTNAEKAAFYSDNPTMAGITQFGQKALNYAPFGVGLAIRAQQAMFPQFVADQQSVARGIDPGTGLQVGGYGSQPGTSGITPTGLYGDQFAGQQSTATGFFGGLAGRSEQAPAPVETRDSMSSPAFNFGKESSIPTGGMVSPGATYGGGADAPGANADGFGGGDAGFGGGRQAFAQGGMVRLKDLLGKAPGPDDGYGALQDGEFVIKRDAVKRYGVKMLEQINRRKIAKKQVSKFFKNHG